MNTNNENKLSNNTTVNQNRAIDKSMKEKDGWEFYRDNKYLLTESMRSSDRHSNVAYSITKSAAKKSVDSNMVRDTRKMMDTLERFKAISRSIAIKTYGSHYLPNGGPYSTRNGFPVDHYAPRWLMSDTSFSIEGFDDKYVLLKSSKHHETPNFMAYRELLYRDLFSFSDRDFAKLMRHYYKSEKARFRLIDLHYMEEEIRQMEQRKAYLLAGAAQKAELAKIAGTGRM